MPQADFQEPKETITGEALLCGLLGRILYEDLDRAWLQTLIAEDVFAESPFGVQQTEIRRGLELMQRWSAENHGGISDEEMTTLEADRLRLFVGLDRVLAPVWGSVYFTESHLVFQEQTLQVREWYARFGLQMERLHQEPDDHIGLELSFIAHLASRAAQAIDEADEAALDSLLQAQRQFLSEHLLRWGPAWARLVKKHAQTDFYRALAHLTHGTLLALADELEIQMPKEVSL
jgi:TorA maturation chaperone TorD